MKRTQIQLTENQMESLRIISISHKKPVAELVRDSVQAFLDREAGSGEAAKRENARKAAGRFSSGSADGSSRHDQHLAAAFGAK
jgi:hypothetical protein